MIAVIDYGVGNLFSLCSSLRRVGADVVVTKDEKEIARADKLVLPGVGAFADAIGRLRTSGLDNVLKRAAANGTPLMGICLGMQLLFERSLEYGEHIGLGLLQGTVAPIKGAVDARLKVPQIGWNGLHITREHPLLRYVHEGEHAYFVHSYYATDCDSSVIATTDYGKPLTAAVAKDNVTGCQFHPEKSGEVGLRILRGFCEL